MPLNRLRQTDQCFKHMLVCPLLTKSDNKLFSTYSAVLDKPAGGGYKQMVYDFHERSADRFAKQNARNIANLRLLPPLHEVQMSKLVYSCASKDVTYTLTDKQPSFKAKMVGANLALSAWIGNLTIKPPSSIGFITVDDKVASYLLQRAYSKMSSAEYDFGVTVGEVAETAAMLAAPLSGITKLSVKALAGVRAIYKHGTTTCIQIAKNATARESRRLLATTRKHPIDTSLRIVDETANHWLAYKFGVLPFVEDVGKVIQFAQDGVAPMFGLRVARVKGWKTDTTSSDLNNLQYVSTWLAFTVSSVQRTIDRHYLGLYWRDRNCVPLIQFAETIGFAPWQLPSLAYELIPLSFVVDRFIDIKSFVRGNIGSLSKDTFGAFCTRKRSTTYSNFVQSITLRVVSAPNSMTADNQLIATAQYDQMHRTINPQRPNFPVVNPYWRDQLVADATNLSLIWGRLRTHVGKLL